MSPATAIEALLPHDEPLDESAARHLLRRTGFGAPPDRVAELLGLTGQAAAQRLIGDAAAAPLPDDPEWLSLRLPARASAEQRQAFGQDNRAWVAEVRTEWIQRMRAYPLLERLTLLWHDHFVTGLSSYRYAAIAFEYLRVLRTHALGNFRQFVYAIGLDPSMLAYLNGNTNTAEAPNENYARELLELFTMGPDGPDGSPNYSQQDVEQLARALTGYVVSRAWRTEFVPRRHDSGQKQLWSQEGPFGYSDAIRILFEERGPQIAAFLAAKLCRELVTPEPDQDVVAALAETLQAQDFEIRPTLETLLASRYFFDESVRGSRIKAPIEHIVGLIEELGVRPSPMALRVFARYADLENQELLDPPNVAGWPGNRAWIDTTSLPLRWTFSAELVSGRRGPVDLAAWAARIHDADDPHAVFHLALAVPRALLAVPLEFVDVPEIDDPFGGDLVTFPIPDWVQSGPRAHADLAKTLLGGAPWYEWSLEARAAQGALASYVTFFADLPAFQLT